MKNRIISIVCPFYNEEKILEASVRIMLKNLESLVYDWELIIVNDGSHDGSLEIARALEKENSHLIVLSYPVNRGRGYAIRTGVAETQGDIVVTTEIDSSWGDDIVHRIVTEFEKHSDADIIIASPHLSGGGYKNVPLMRVFLSTIGNYIIRTGLTYNVTMNTGMTRGYRREQFLRLPLDENEKEMHLEIISKALAFGYHIYEIPAVLEWRDAKLAIPSGKKRQSSSKVNKLIRTHLLFSVMASPFRYLYFFSIVLFIVGTITFLWAFYRLFTPFPSIYVLVISFFMILFGFLFAGIGILAQQGRAIQREMWHIRSDIRSISYGLTRCKFDDSKEG